MFPKSQTVAFHFYRGRFYLYQEEYKKAEDDLALALKDCHRSVLPLVNCSSSVFFDLFLYTLSVLPFRDASSNKRRILQFLIPLRLRNNVLPPHSLLRYALCHIVFLDRERERK